MHWWANQACQWLLRTLTFRIIWIYQFICQQLSLPLNNAFLDCPSQMNWNLMISITKFTHYRSLVFAIANHQIFVHLWGTIMQGPYIETPMFPSKEICLTILSAECWSFYSVKSTQCIMWWTFCSDVFILEYDKTVISPMLQYWRYH